MCILKKKSDQYINSNEEDAPYNEHFKQKICPRRTFTEKTVTSRTFLFVRRRRLRLGNIDI